MISLTKGLVYKEIMVLSLWEKEQKRFSVKWVNQSQITAVKRLLSGGVSLQVFMMQVTGFKVFKTY